MVSKHGWTTAHVACTNRQWLSIMGCWRCSSSSRSRSRAPLPAQGLRRYEPSEDDESPHQDESSCETGSGEPDSSEDDGRSVGYADMSTPNLASLKAADGPELEQHKVYANNGTKTSRIRTVLSGKKASGCQCDKQCFGVMNKH